MAESEKPGERKQETNPPDAKVAQPVTAPPQKPPATGDTRRTGDDPQPPQPLLVQLVGGDELEPFEVQTLAISRETLSISRRTYWIAIFGFLAALAAACFVGVQVGEMTDQTQILGSQSESAAAGAAIGELNIRKQLGIAQQQSLAAQDQAKAAQKSVQAIEGQTFQSERPWIAVSIAPAPDFQYDVDRTIIMLKFTLTNVGHSLAKYTSVWTRLSMNEKWPGDQKRICAIPKLKINSKSDYGYLLFPGQTVTDTIPAAASPEDVKRELATTPFQGGGVVSFDVVVCVDYESIIDSRHHQTRLVRGLGYPDPRGLEMGAFAPNIRYSPIILSSRLHGDSAD